MIPQLKRLRTVGLDELGDVWSPDSALELLALARNRPDRPIDGLDHWLRHSTTEVAWQRVCKKVKRGELVLVYRHSAWGSR